MQDHTLVVDGIPIRWSEQGQGVPVVFVHGIPTSRALWRHVVPRVRDARCLAWEMVGYGGSIPEGRDRDISVARQADYLVAWMAELGLDRATVVGHDLGGGVAQILAAHHPERISGLVLINSIGYDSWPIPSVAAMQRMPAFAHRLPNAAIYPMLASLLWRGHDNTEMARESIRLHWRPYAEHGAAPSILRQTSALRTRDTQAVASRLPQLDVPATVVWGAADQFQKVSYGERLALDLGADLDRIDGGKHFVPEDHPDRVAAAVDRLVHV